MRFDSPAEANPIDQLKVVGKPTDRIDGKFKTTGTAPYAYERHDVVANQAYGYILGSAIAKGRVRAMNVAAAKAAPGVLAVVTTLDMPRLGRGRMNAAYLFGGAEIQHYHQAIAIVVAESFEQARAATHLIAVDYAREDGKFDLASEVGNAKAVGADSGEGSGANAVHKVGDFDAAFAAAPVKIDETYTTPDESHAMMEPHATIAAWAGDKLTLWTSNQMIRWGKEDIAKTLGIAAENVRLDSPYIGGGFGVKLFVRADAALAALAAKAAGRPVKVALQRPLIMNNTTHRPATIQRIRLGADRDGKLTAIAHESTSGNLPDGKPETAVDQTKLLYAGANRMTVMRLAALDLPEGNSMRAPGEASGMMALEIAMDEMAEKLAIDPVRFRILNDTQVDPEKPERPFSTRRLVECLRTGAERFGWTPHPGAPRLRREGAWLVGVGMASAIRGAPVQKSAARVRLDRRGIVTVETDMTDVGTGSYTIVAQTAAEMMGVDVASVMVRLGDSRLPESPGTGGQWGAASVTAGVYAACHSLREQAARQLGLDPDIAIFANGQVQAGTHKAALAEAARQADLVAEETMEYGDLAQQYALQTFGAHFVEVGVHGATGEIRLRRMLAVCAAGRILNPKTARSQVIGAMTMGAGAALMEELVVDRRHGFFVNHDLAGYEVPVHADVPHQDVIFLDVGAKLKCLTVAN
jgi:xanthine dehydrogenase YagR molybdenum-binding subunit